jgi:hypothetical protein
MDKMAKENEKMVCIDCQFDLVKPRIFQLDQLAILPAGER